MIFSVQVQAKLNDSLLVCVPDSTDMWVQDMNVVSPVVTVDAIAELIDFFKSTWGTLNFHVIFVLLIVNVLIGAIQLFVPFGQIRREKKLAEHKLKITKKHEYIETIHIQMCSTLNSLFFSDLAVKISQLVDLKTHSGLYIDNRMKGIIQNFIESAEKRDYAKCMSYLVEFEKLYKK